MTGAATYERHTSSRPSSAREAPEAAALREILVPSDLSPASDRAFDHARLLAEQFHSRLVLYHAVEVDDSKSVGDPPQPAREVWRRVELAAHEHMARRVAGLAVGSEIRMERTTSVHEALVAFVRARHADLTVMATHGRGGFAHLVLGSVTETVLHHARTPVLCVREPEHGVALPYRRVLVPTDLSEASRRAFPLAALLARAFDAEVLAVHAVGLRTGATSGVTDVVESRVPSEEAVLAFLQPDFAGVRVAPRVELGSAWDRITETARQDRADVIVMSTHGPDSLTDRVLGSHAERVVRHAPCPVLVV
ncbi:MAG: universal stress protein [Acidobacteria bacterium]|nr:universal stress protein [Acidobacteriota bacterium]